MFSEEFKITAITRYFGTLARSSFSQYFPSGVFKFFRFEELLLKALLIGTECVSFDLQTLKQKPNKRILDTS